jgi:hypothetical protein
MFNTKVCHQDPLMYEVTHCGIGDKVRKPFHFWLPDALFGGKGWWIHCDVEIYHFKPNWYHVIAVNDLIGPIIFQVYSHHAFYLVLIIIYMMIEERILPQVMDWNQLDAEACTPLLPIPGE